jgi:hypothetical protein
LQGDLKSQREKASIYRTECQRAGTVNPRFADYANLILDWHKRYGLKKAEMRWDNKETRLNYQHALEQFLQRKKMGDGQLVSDIARCQSSGIFEAFFSEKLPPQMLRKFGGSIPELDRGATVGQIARLIIAGEELYEKEGDNSTDIQFECRVGAVASTAKAVNVR